MMTMLIVNLYRKEGWFLSAFEPSFDPFEKLQNGNALCKHGVIIVFEELSTLELVILVQGDRECLPFPTCFYFRQLCVCNNNKGMYRRPSNRHVLIACKWLPSFSKVWRHIWWALPDRYRENSKALFSCAAFPYTQSFFFFGHYWLTLSWPW